MLAISEDPGMKKLENHSMLIAKPEAHWPDHKITLLYCSQTLPDHLQLYCLIFIISFIYTLKKQFQINNRYLQPKYM